MFKRFTDCHKWQDPWFRKLPVAYKSLWNYMCDTCDNSGLWKVDLDIASAYIGEKLDEVKAVMLLGDRIAIVRDDYWFIKRFIEFQFGELSPSSPLHKSVLNLIEKHRLRLGLAYPSVSPQVKVKDKVKEKVKEKEREDVGDIAVKNKHQEFVLLSEDELSKLKQRIGSRLPDFIENLNNYIGQTGKKYRSHYHTILTWYKKEQKENPNASDGGPSLFSPSALVRAKREAEKTRTEP